MADFDQRVTLHRPNALLRAAAAAPFLVCAAAIVAFLLGRVDLAPAMVASIDAAVFGVVFSSYVRRRNPRPKKVGVRLEADAAGVRVDGAKVLAREKILHAYVQPWPGGPPTVRLVGRLGMPLLEVEVADEREGRALLDALRLGVAHRATRFQGASPIPRARRTAIVLGFSVLAAVAMIALKRMHVDQDIGMFAGLLGFLAVPFTFPSSIHVGADGVLVTWMWTRRYVAYSDLAGVKAHDDGVRLWLHSGDAIDVPVMRRRGRAARAIERMRRDALVARIEEAMRGARAQGKPAEVAAMVARSGRSMTEWLSAVRALLGGEERGYRVAAVPAENLWRVAEDPGAEESARVGAAVALRAQLDDDGRARLLRVAEASVSPRVRVALRAAATAEDDEALMAALEGDDPAPARALARG